MKRSEVRAFLKEGVDALNPSVEFNSGLITFFNSNRTWNYKIVHQEILPVDSDALVTFSYPTDEYQIKLWIADIIKVDAVPSEYEPVIDDCDEIAQKLRFRYNFVVSGYKLTTLSNFKRTPFVKKFADCLAGVILTFNIKSPDLTSDC